MSGVRKLRARRGQGAAGAHDFRAAPNGCVEVLVHETTVALGYPRARCAHCGRVLFMGPAGQEGEFVWMRVEVCPCGPSRDRHVFTSDPFDRDAPTQRDLDKLLRILHGGREEPSTPLPRKLGPARLRRR